MLTLMLALLLGAPQATAAPAVDDLAWLAGCWRVDRGSRVIEEIWLAPSGTMLGVSRTVANGRTVEHEFLQIRVLDGKVVYIAQPSGQQGATFTATTVSAREVVFENPAHDFPQRVLYRPTDAGISARIEGTMNGTPRGIDFPYVRAACPGR